MRMIPKKVNIKNTVWKCYSFPDILVALGILLIIFFAISAENWAFAIIMLIVAVVLFMPTQDGIFYTYLFSLIKFATGRKKFVRTGVRTTAIAQKPVARLEAEKQPKDGSGNVKIKFQQVLFKSKPQEKTVRTERMDNSYGRNVRTNDVRTLPAAPAKGTIENLLGIRDLRPNGTLVYQGGYFGKVLKLGQKNYYIEDEDSQNADVECFANALKMLEGAQCADLVKLDRPLNFDGFSKAYFDRLSALEHGDHSPADEVRIKIMTERVETIDSLNNVEKEYASQFYLVVYDRNEADLERLTLNVHMEIARSGISVRELNAREAAVFYKYSFSRNFDERDVQNAKDSELLSWAIPKEVTFSGNHYMVDGVEASVFAIADYPLYVTNAWGARLFNIPNTKIVMHIAAEEKNRAIRRIDHVIGEMQTKRLTSDRASEANSADSHQETMEVLLTALQQGNENLLNVTLTVTAYKYLDDANYRRSVRRDVLVNNFKLSTLYGLQQDGFVAAGLTPVCTLKSYTTGINSTSLAAVFPFVRTVCMDDGGILLGTSYDSGYPFILNIWKRDALHQNSNGMVIGLPGSGKSYFLKTLLLNEWSNGTKVIVLDPEAEYLGITRNACGNVIDVGSAQEGRINPFHVYQILSEDGSPAATNVTFSTHLKTLESFFRIVLGDVSSDVLELVNNLALEAYARRGINETTDCTQLPPEAFPVFADLLEILKGRDVTAMDEYTRREKHIAELYLEKFVTGRYSDLWNAPSTLRADADMIDFNFQSLFANKNNVVANAQMLLVFRWIEQAVINARERNRSGDAIHTLIVCDEAHLFIDSRFPIALDFFYSMNKRIRKYGGSFIPATQNIADWNANEELRSKSSAIIKNSQYTFIFKLSSPDMADVLDLYRAGESFNDDERAMIMRAETGQAFFVGSTEFRAGVEIIASPDVESLFDEEGGIVA